MIKVLETSITDSPGPGGKRPVPAKRTDAVNAKDLDLDVRGLERELRETVRGKDANDAQTAMAICHRYNAPVTPRGGGTSLTGASCGMAGAFGFEQSHYDMSIKCGERVLLPKVRDPKAQTIVLADGFSCREQIMQTTKRQALHPAEVMKMAMDDRGYARDDAYPELRFLPDKDKKCRRITMRGYAVPGGFALLAAGAAAGAIIFAGKRK